MKKGKCGSNLVCKDCIQVYWHKENQTGTSDWAGENDNIIDI